MNDPMSDSEGLQPQVKTKLEAQRIMRPTLLKEHTQTRQQRTELARKIGTTLPALKELANRADQNRKLKNS